MSGNYGYRGGRHDNNGQQRRNSGRDRDRDRAQSNSRGDDYYGSNRFDHERRGDTRPYKRPRYDESRERHHDRLNDGNSRESYQDRLIDGDYRETYQERIRDGDPRESYQNRSREDDFQNKYHPHDGPNHRYRPEESDHRERYDANGEGERNHYNATDHGLKEGGRRESASRDDTPRGRPSSESYVHRERDRSPAAAKRNMSLGDRPAEPKSTDQVDVHKSIQPEEVGGDSIKPTTSKTYSCPWIEILGITSQSCSESLEKRYLQIKEADEAILETYEQRARLEQSAYTLARHLRREELNVALTTEKLEEFSYI